MRKHLGIMVLVFVFSGVGSEVIAQTLHYDNFADVSALRLNGSALTVGSGANTALRVAYPGAVSSAFTNTTFSTNVFSTRFDFRISDVGGVADSTGSVGGDGFTFCLQAVSPTNIGQGGGTLGYGNTGDPSAHAISPSFAVEFDTYMNGEFDPNSNHLGIDVNGNVSHPLALPTAFVAPPFDDGNTWHAWIDYYNNILEVRASESSARPVTPLLSYQTDIPATLGSASAFVGFTGAAASAYGNYDILNWDYQGSSTPEPSTLGLLGVAAISLLFYAWRRRRLSA